MADIAGLRAQILESFAYVYRHESDQSVPKIVVMYNNEDDPNFFMAFLFKESDKELQDKFTGYGETVVGALEDLMKVFGRFIYRG